jgi:hypothetical protein
MKSVVLCVCALALAFQLSNSTEIKQHLKSAIETIDSDVETCMTENNMNSDDWYREQEIMTDVHAQNVERTKKNGCTVACILEKQNLMDGSNINEMKVHAEITKIFRSTNNPDEGKAHKIARKCMKNVKSITEKCEKTFALYECVARVIHKEQEHDEHERKETEEEEDEEEKETTTQAK